MANKNESYNFEISSKLSIKEINKLMAKFGQYGLRADEDLEYFTWQQDGKKLFIPKQSTIPLELDGRTEYIKIADYIEKLFKNKNKFDEKRKETKMF